MRTRKTKPYINKYFLWNGQMYMIVPNSNPRQFEDRYIGYRLNHFPDGVDRNVRIGTFTNKKQMVEFIKNGGSC